MSKNVLLVVDAVSNEKGVDKEIIFEAIEAALASATRKRYTENIDARVAVNRSDGTYETFRRWEVMDDAEEAMTDADGEPVEMDPARHVWLTRARELQPEIAVGEYIEEPMQSEEFGRIAAQAAKQVIVQKVREAEREQIVEAYAPRIGELVNGIVKRLDHGNMTIDLGVGVEALVTRDQMIPREPMRPGDRVRGYLGDVRAEARGPQLFVSRTAPELLLELFKLEVPEVGQGLIELKGASRDPGLRAKIAVQAKDKRIDPVGACVGMRGSRVQSISNELAGERVDIVLWDEDPAHFVINAMAPANVESIVMDEESRSMRVAVDEDNLAQAIGRGGQNVRLASELTGWNLNVMTLQESESVSEEEAETLQKMFMEDLDVDEEVSVVLVQEGFSSVEEVAYVPTSELLEIEEFNEDIVEELRNRARDVLLTRAIASAEGGGAEPAEDLLELEGMDRDTAKQLAGAGIVTREDLAEQATDDVVEAVDMDAERAAALVMEARAPWFAEEESTDRS